MALTMHIEYHYPHQGVSEHVKKTLFAQPVVPTTFQLNHLDLCTADGRWIRRLDFLPPAWAIQTHDDLLFLQSGAWTDGADPNNTTVFWISDTGYFLTVQKYRVIYNGLSEQVEDMIAWLRLDEAPSYDLRWITWLNRPGHRDARETPLLFETEALLYDERIKDTMTMELQVIDIPFEVFNAVFIQLEQAWRTQRLTASQYSRQWIPDLSTCVGLTWSTLEASEPSFVLTWDGSIQTYRDFLTMYALTETLRHLPQRVKLREAQLTPTDTGWLRREI